MLANSVINEREDEMKLVKYQKLKRSDEYLFSIILAYLKYFIL